MRDSRPYSRYGYRNGGGGGGGGGDDMVVARAFWFLVFGFLFLVFCAH